MEKLADKDFQAFMPDHVITMKAGNKIINKSIEKAKAVSEGLLITDREPDTIVYNIVKNDRPDSLEVREDAKGNFHISVKVYGDFLKESEIDRAHGILVKIRDRLKPDFGRKV